MTSDEASSILSSPPHLADWLSLGDLNADNLARVFANVEAARRADPEATRRVIEAVAQEYDDLVRYLGQFSHTLPLHSSEGPL
jgi:hypothetical protein